MSTEYSTEFTSLYPQEAPGGGGGGGRTINVKRLIRLRGPLIILITLLIGTPLAVAVWFVVPPQYKAVSTIQIYTNPQRVLAGGPNTSEGEYTKFVQTQVALIGDNVILSKVVADPAVRGLDWVKKQDDPLHFLMSQVNARWRGGSELIDVTCTSPDRKAAITIVSKTVEVYMKYVTNIESEGSGQRRRLLVEERDRLEKELQLQRQTIGRLKTEAGITSNASTPTGQIGLEYYHERLGEAKAELTTAQTAIEGIEALVARLEELREEHQENPTEPIHEFGVEEKVSLDPTASRLRGEEATTATRIADLEAIYRADAPNSPLTSARESIAGIRKQLAATTAQIRTEILNNVYEEHRRRLDSAQKQAQDAQARVDQFNGIIAEHEDKLDQTAQAMAAIDEEESKLEQLRASLDSIREQIRIHDVNERAPGRVQQPSPTSAPANPTNSERLKFILMVFVFAGGVGVAIGLLLEFLDNQIRSVQDVRFLTDLPVLAAIPDTSVDKQIPADANPALVTADYPDSTSSDEFRRVITRIIYPPEGSAELNTVLVTAPSRGDGKTSVACNLAIALAQANRRVLLLDISARRPSVERNFGMERAPGLGEIFGGEASADDLMRPTEFANLFILGPGKKGRDIIGRLASREIVEFLEEAEQAFEHVIIDTPPLLLMSDAKLLAPIVDGVMVVVGAGVSSEGMVKRCLNDLRQLGANIVGVALNRIKPTRGGYMLENLTKYYDYHHEAENDGPAARGPRPRTAVTHTSRKQEETAEPAQIVLLDEDDEVIGEVYDEDDER